MPANTRNVRRSRSRSPEEGSEVSRFRLASTHRSSSQRARSYARSSRHHSRQLSPASSVPYMPKVASVIHVPSTSPLYNCAPHLRPIFDARDIISSRQSTASVFNELDRLPAAHPDSLASLADDSAFVDFNLLLKLSSSANKHEAGPSSSKSDPEIKDFATWIRAFHIFAAHRSFHFPQMSLTLWKYVGVMAQLARAHPVNKWINYDIAFRTYASQNPTDINSWATLHQSTFFDGIMNTVAVLTPDTDLPRPQRKIACYECGGPHIRPHCPLLKKKQFTDQPFRKFPGGNGDFFCDKFNLGFCRGPCPDFKVHACSDCLPVLNHGHGRFNHTNFLSTKAANPSRDKDST